MADDPFESEVSEAARRLVELLRTVDRSSIDALQYSDRRPMLRQAQDAFSREAEAIGKRLMALGGAAVLHRVVRLVRRGTASGCDRLEDFWSYRLPGYEKVRWLP